MARVVTMEEGLAHQGEIIVVVSHCEHHAILTIPKHIPNQMFASNSDPLILEHYQQVFKLPLLAAINENHS